MRFNVLDAVVVALLVLSAYLGSRGGPLKKFITLLTTVAAVVISMRLILLKLLDLPGSSLRTGSLLYHPMVNLAPVSFDALRTAVPEGGEFRQLSREHPAKP